MSLMRYEAWPAIGRWHRDLDRLFDEITEFTREQDSQPAWQPRVDIYEYSDRFELAADLPGVDPASVDITLKNGLLELSGERSTLVNDEGVQRRRKERRDGRFYRSFQLPDAAETEGVSAESRHGVIFIRIPKRAQAQPIKVQVTS